jgi:hypothetical protein
LCEKRRTKKIGRMQKVNCVKREEWGRKEEKNDRLIKNVKWVATGSDNYDALNSMGKIEWLMSETLFPGDTLWKHETKVDRPRQTPEVGHTLTQEKNKVFRGSVEVSTT